MTTTMTTRRAPPGLGMDSKITIRVSATEREEFRRAAEETGEKDPSRLIRRFVRAYIDRWKREGER
jgi:hypothetical protein